MSEPVLHVVAHIRAKEESVAEVRAAVESFIAPTRAEDGCLRYDLLLNEDDPTEFVFVEEWRDEAALEVHAATPHILAGRERMAGRLAAPVAVRKYRQIG